MKNILSEVDMLRAYFEKETREQWGWSNFEKETDGRYVSSIVMAAWLSFKHGVSIGKELAT